MDELIKLIRSEKYNDALSFLEKLPTNYIYDFIESFQSSGYDIVNDFLINLSQDQLKKWQWLASSKREQEEILSHSDVRDDDIAFLKTTDF